jgi:AraC-like DNA-binding protein
MVCKRCQLTVKRELDQMGISYNSIELGEVDVSDEVTKEELLSLNSRLKDSGLEIFEGKSLLIAEKIKLVVIEMIHSKDLNIRSNFSEYLSKRMNYDYSYLSRLFFNTQGITIHQYIIAQRIEKAKELLMDGELNLSQIAYKLNYSSVAHLSNQFKKVTSLSPSEFLKLKQKKRYCIDEIGKREVTQLTPA